MFMKKIRRFFSFTLVCVLAGLLIFFGKNFVFAEEESENLEIVCALEEIDESCNFISHEECQALLEKCKDYYEQESAAIEEDITETKTKERSYSNQVYLLNRKISQLNNEIYESNLIIKDIGIQVEDTEVSIEKTSLKIKETEKSLVEVLRIIYQEDQESLLEILLSEEKFSDFFNDLMSLEALSNQNKKLLQEIKTLKTYLGEQKEDLSVERLDLEKVVRVQTFQQKQSSVLKQDQEYLLRLTQAEYQEHLEEKEKIEAVATEIRARLFSLAGDTKAPTFGEAISVANLVTSQISVRTAFLLAIISQESAMGRNVGQCYVTNKVTGAGTYKDGSPLSRLMQSKQDLPIFLSMVGDAFSQIPVSCWIPQCAVRWNGTLYFCGASVNSVGDILCAKSGYVPFGFGGAMGPAQFIPRTWNLYVDKVKYYTGNNSPDPWNIRDAFTASALLLFDKGASSQAYWDEYNAASRYYGGSNSYARQVMGRAECIQSFIDNGVMSSDCQDLIF